MIFACAGIFSGSSHTSDLNIGTPVATVPSAWRYRVSAGTGRLGKEEKGGGGGEGGEDDDDDDAGLPNLPCQLVISV